MRFPFCLTALLLVAVAVSVACVAALESTISQDKTKVKYRHRRENDDDENFIALAPAEDDDFNLETVMKKDKHLTPPPVVVWLDPVTYEDDDGDTEVYNAAVERQDAPDDDKYNRFFDNADINEERKRMAMNESQQLVSLDDNVAAEEEDDEDYLDLITTTTTSTSSPYVREIYRSKHHRNHHSKFKKKHHKQHHRKHHNLDEGRVFTYPHVPSYRTNYPQYNQGHVSFYDNPNKDRFGSSSNNKWTHFSQVKHHLEAEQAQTEEDLPPYIKKYNRRNKQLMDLLEGTTPPAEPPRKKKKKHDPRGRSHRRNLNWMEEDLFEAQRPSRGEFGVAYEATIVHPNALPGENGLRDTLNLSPVLTLNGNQSLATNNHSPPIKISSRAGQFVYHTVTVQPAAASSASVKKKRLPFVAITDRKVGGPPKSRRNNNIINNLNGNSKQNHLPLP